MENYKLREVQLHEDCGKLNLLARRSYVGEGDENDSEIYDEIIGIPIADCGDILNGLESLTRKEVLFSKPISFFGFSPTRRKNLLRQLKKAYLTGNYKNIPCLRFS